MEKNLYIQTPVEEVFEPLKISWGPLLWVPFTSSPGIRMILDVLYGESSNLPPQTSPQK